MLRHYRRIMGFVGAKHPGDGLGDGGQRERGAAVRPFPRRRAGGPGAMPCRRLSCARGWESAVVAGQAPVAVPAAYQVAFALRFVEILELTAIVGRVHVVQELQLPAGDR